MVVSFFAVLQLSFGLGILCEEVFKTLFRKVVGLPGWGISSFL
jgi:hypothetical protein